MSMAMSVATRPVVLAAWLAAWLALACTGAAATAGPTVESMIVVRSSPLAGFQFHAAGPLFAQM